MMGFHRLDNSLAPLVAALTLLAFPSAAFAEKKGDWEFLRTHRGVKVWGKEVEGSDVKSFRGEIVADIEIGKLMATFFDAKQRKHWVDRYNSHGTIIKTENTETYWIHFALPWPVSDRDYVLKARRRIDEKKRVVTVNIKSIKNKARPENDCCVRATTYGTYYRFEALPGNKTKLEVEVHTDPKGALPTWLINLIQKSWPSKTLGNLLDHSKKQNPTADSRYAKWHTPYEAPPVEAKTSSVAAQ